MCMSSTFIPIFSITCCRVTQTCDRLHISTVNVNDTGSYICRVYNEVTDPDQPESTSNPLNLMYCSKCCLL